MGLFYKIPNSQIIFYFLPSIPNFLIPYPTSVRLHFSILSLLFIIPKSRLPFSPSAFARSRSDRGVVWPCVGSAAVFLPFVLLSPFQTSKVVTLRLPPLPTFDIRNFSSSRKISWFCLMEEKHESTLEERCSTEPTVDPLASESALQKKHIAMLNRLNARHLQKSNSSSSYSATNSVQSFLDKFSDSKRSVESSIECFRTDFNVHGSGPQLKLDLEKVSSSIAELEKFVAENSYLLPPYEVRAALKSISDVKDAVEKVSGELLPRKKFSFRNKVAKKDCGGGLVRKVEQMKVTDPILVERSTLVRDSPGFRNRESATLVKDFRISEENVGDFSLCDLNMCEIYLKGRFRALFVHNLRNCRVFVGPILGSILIEDVENCVFMLASHQIRIHVAKATDFYLRLRSRPIIEDCKGLRFGPYKLFYEGIKKELGDSGLEEDTGNWANVDDFRWLKAVQSPNWSLLEEKEQEGTVSISDICERG